MADLFEKAVRTKLRFETSKGQLSLEEVCDLPLTSTTGKTNLYDIARTFRRELKSL